MRRIHRLVRVAPLFAALLLTSACVTKSVQPPRTGTGAGASLGPTLVVEQFLRAANTRDLDTMARLFGTTDGPIVRRDTRQNVERRMYLIAEVLQHQDFRFVREGIVPGRSEVAKRLDFDLTMRGQPVRVPFTIVRAKDDWLVEEIDLEAITSARAGTGTRR